MAYLPPHKLSLTPEERAAPPPTPVERGRDEVAALCAVLPEGSEDRDECEDALQYYDRLASGDGDACSLAAAAAGAAGAAAGAAGAEPASAPSSPSSPSPSSSSRFADPACADEKERFESFVRELLYANSVSGFVKALGRRKHEEERRREKEAAAGAGGGGGGGGAGASTSSPSSPAAPSAAAIDAETERRRAGLVALFRRYDRDGNGRLDAAEFREAAAAAGDPLTGSEVAKIFTALDIHGAGVSLDDFLAAVEVRRREGKKEEERGEKKSFARFFVLSPLSSSHPPALHFTKKKNLSLPPLVPGRGLHEAGESPGGVAAGARWGRERRGAPRSRPVALRGGSREKEKRERTQTETDFVVSFFFVERKREKKKSRC